MPRFDLSHIDVDEVADLAEGVLTETLHGSVPMETVAKLAEGVLALKEEIDDLRLQMLADGERDDMEAGRG